MGKDSRNFIRTSDGLQNRVATAMTFASTQSGWMGSFSRSHTGAEAGGGVLVTAEVPLRLISRNTISAILNSGPIHQPITTGLFAAW